MAIYQFFHPENKNPTIWANGRALCKFSRGQFATENKEEAEKIEAALKHDYPKFKSVVKAKKKKVTKKAELKPEKVDK